MDAFKRQCIALRKQDHTLPEIVRITGRPKTSVYFHIKGIPLSERKQSKIRECATERARVVARARKGKARRPFRTFASWTPELVLLVAHLLFDGGLGNSCVYNNRSVSLVLRVKEYMRLLYDYEPAVYTNPKTKVHRISYHNIALANFLIEKEAELVRQIHTFPQEHQRAFLSAFFDDEGCMDFREKRNLRRVRGYQNDKNILHIVRTLLANFGISAELKGKNEVVISGKENLSTFQQEINFSKGVRINGNRPNSIWKKSIEKRTLLKRAIKSFKS